MKRDDALVAAVRRMDENSHRQTEVLENMSRSFGLLIAKQGKQTGKQNPSPRKKAEKGGRVG